MKRIGLRYALPALGLCAAAGLFAGLGAEAVPAAVKATSAPAAVVPKITKIVVTPGKPSELSFKLSKFSNVPAGTITFVVTNQGLAFHNFKICSLPSATTLKNACLGKATKILKHGQTATLTVKISRTGTYEYLCTVPGHAAAGMKGLIGIGVPAKAPVAVSTTKPTTTTTTTTAAGGGAATTTTATGAPTTTTTPATGGGGGGKFVLTDPACPPGQTIVTAGGGDADGDELGTEPNDNDGCV